MGQEKVAVAVASVRSVLVLGGARSGKSAYAQSLAEANGSEKLYLATAEPGDEEMAARIARHQAERGDGWTTLEEPLKVPQALRSLARPGRVILVDCLTLWLSNMMLAGRDPAAAIARLADAVDTLRGPAILVSNEIGLGIVPEHKLGRNFRDWHGQANREIARTCDAAVFIAAGLPVQLKPAPGPSVRLT
jgi:adenosylcobinamide kinase / adenosylcobinamide-phosphate guanylyltransferase